MLAKLLNVHIRRRHHWFKNVKFLETYPSFATKSTYTCVGLDSKSIWVNSSKVDKLCLDTCVQVEESSDKVINIKEGTLYSHL